MKTILEDSSGAHLTSQSGFRMTSAHMERKEMKVEGMFSSKTMEWTTPQELFNELDSRFHFNLVPCSTHENAKCEMHYTIEDDGLAQNWGAEEYSVIHHMEERLVNG